MASFWSNTGTSARQTDTEPRGRDAEPRRGRDAEPRGRDAEPRRGRDAEPRGRDAKPRGRDAEPGGRHHAWQRHDGYRGRDDRRDHNNNNNSDRRYERGPRRRHNLGKDGDDDDEQRRKPVHAEMTDQPPALACVIRPLQDCPYQCVVGRTILHCAQRPDKYALRPHVIQKHLVDLYVKLNGNYGVNVPDPYALLPAVIERSKRRRSPGRADAAGDQPPQPGADGASSVQQQQQQAPQAAAGAQSDVDAMRGFRQRQMEQLQRRDMQPKLCSFYNTKEGCRRGSDCPFLHQQLSANPTNSAAATIAAPTPASAAAAVFARSLGKR